MTKDLVDTEEYLEKFNIPHREDEPVQEPFYQSF
jgi:hypothetical protein